MKKTLLLLLSLQLVLHIQGFTQQPGDLDNSFGTGGAAYVPSVPCRDVKVQPDGKIVVVTSYTWSVPATSAVIRYNANGTLDSSFGINGINTINVGPANNVASALEIQPDGKIIVVGNYDTGNAMNFMLLRYDTVGRPDSSFGINGISLTDFGSGTGDTGISVSLQPDGKIIVGGSSNQQHIICRYKPDGMLDSTFAGNGKLAIGVPSASSQINSIALQNDGKIVAGGGYSLFRILPDGTPDNTFGVSGESASVDFINDIALQTDGKIVAACLAGDFLVERFNTDGSLDTSFDHDGQTGLVFNNPGTAISYSVIVQPDGRIVATGVDIGGLITRTFALARFNANGQLDQSFGSNGKVTTYISAYEQGYASAYYPNNKLVIAGWSDDGSALLRYHLGTMLDVKAISDKDENVVLAPNPTMGMLNITADQLKNGLWQLEITDVAGKTVTRETIKVTDGSIKKQVSLNALPEGMYLLTLDNGTVKKVFRVIKK